MIRYARKVVLVFGGLGMLHKYGPTVFNNGFDKFSQWYIARGEEN